MDLNNCHCPGWLIIIMRGHKWGNVTHTQTDTAFYSIGYIILLIWICFSGFLTVHKRSTSPSLMSYSTTRLWESSSSTNQWSSQCTCMSFCVTQLRLSVSYGSDQAVVTIAERASGRVTYYCYNVTPWDNFDTAPLSWSPLSAPRPRPVWLRLRVSEEIWCPQSQCRLCPHHKYPPSVTFFLGTPQFIFAK